MVEAVSGGSGARNATSQCGRPVPDDHIFRDDGYSGASLRRPGLDRLRDLAALTKLDRILITDPDRLARNYVHQVLLMEELQRHGAQVEFADRPLSNDPQDQLLLQIRGAVADYERTLIAERTRRGRLHELQTGQMLPWTRPPYGYRADPDRPRDPAGVRTDPTEAVVVADLFRWYADEGRSLMAATQRLHDLGVRSPSGKEYWGQPSVRGILSNPTYTGTIYGNQTRVRPRSHPPLGHALGCGLRAGRVIGHTTPLPVARTRAVGGFPLRDRVYCYPRRNSPATPSTTPVPYARASGAARVLLNPWWSDPDSFPDDRLKCRTRAAREWGGLCRHRTADPHTCAGSHSGGSNTPARSGTLSEGYPCAPTPSTGTADGRP